jgi:hypothetical protein
MKLKIIKQKARSFEKILKRTKFDYKIVGEKNFVKLFNGNPYIIETEIFELTHTADRQRNEYFVAGVTINNNDVVRTYDFTDSKMIPAEYQGLVRCDDCKKNHTKKNAVILCNRYTKEFKILGGGCMERYIHGTELSEFLHLSERYDEEILDEKNIDWETHGRPAVDKNRLIFLVYNEIKDRGFVAKDESSPDNSTYTKLRVFLDYVAERGLYESLEQPDEEFLRRFDEFINQDSRFLGNSIVVGVQKIFHPESSFSFVDYEFHLGEFIFTILKMIREERFPCGYKQMPAGKYKGLPVEIDSIKNYSSMYGVGKVVNMIHQNHLLSWFTTTRVDVKEREHYLIDVTVTDVYSEEFCSTKVSRVKFTKGDDHETQKTSPPDPTGSVLVD